jgi:transposase
VVDGERVVDVPAKLAARVRVFSQGHDKKTDRDDAVSIALAALDANGFQAVALDDTTVTLRLLSDRRQELVALRTQAICRLHRLLAELTPGGVRRELTATKAAAVLARLRPRDEPGRIPRQLAMDHLGDVRSLDRRIKAVGNQIPQGVAATGTTLVGIFGVGPVIAGRLLAEVGNAARFPDKDHFASYNGIAPIDASSGEQQRNRLSRAGNRRINHALHMAAVTQLRNPTSAGRDYYDRKLAAGKTRKEALRCLKRRLSDVVFRHLIIHSNNPAATVNTTMS